MSSFTWEIREEDYVKQSRFKREVEKLRRQVEKLVKRRARVELPKDPVEFCIKVLGFKPTSYQERLLRSSSKRIVLRWARQTGKTHILAARMIWYAAHNPGTLSLIVAPGLRQSMILADRIHELLNRMPNHIRKALVEKALRTVIRFRNGSQIVALPNSEHLLRGYTAHQVIVDEAAFFQNDETIFHNILIPMLATTDGTLIVSSTPWGKRTVFYQLNQDPDYEKIVVTWREAAKEGRYKPGFLRELEKMKVLRPEKFKMEFEAEFIEDVDSWLTQDLLAKACSEDLEYIPFEASPKGEFYAGVDLAERVDYNVIAVVQRDGDVLKLVHMKRFPLGTSIASVIGYMKVLYDRWKTIRRVYVDTTKHGDYVVQDMKEAGIEPAQGITFTVPRKMEMAQLMRDRMREGRLLLPFDRELLDELNVERYELSKDGKIRFTHPEGTHDDRFWALALAVYAAEAERTSGMVTRVR